MVNNAFVTQLLGGANAVGRRVRYVRTGQSQPVTGEATTEYEIVGVVTDLSTNAVEPDWYRSSSTRRMTRRAPRR